jgi:hypothetical protein
MRRRLQPTLAQFFKSRGWRRVDVESDNSDILTIREKYVAAANALFASTTGDFRSRLYSVGLTKKTADALWDAVSSLVDYSLTDVQLFDVCVSWTLGAFRATKGSSVAFPSSPRVVDTWFELAPGMFAYNMHERREDVVRTLPVMTTRNSRLWFHATSWRGFDTILAIGIVPSKGRKCLDFGILPSFYVTPQYSTGLEYADKCARLWKGEACILAFRLHVSPKGLRTKSFESATPEWRELVGSSRMCVDEFNELDTYDVIYGPMVANPNDASLGSRPKTHRVPKLQLAAKKERACEFLMRSLVGVVFLNKQSS